MFWPRGRASFALEPTAGELNRNARFANAEAVLIVEAHARGIHPRSLAKIWGCSKSTIWAIVKGITYREATIDVRRKTGAKDEL